MATSAVAARSGRFRGAFSRGSASAAGIALINTCASIGGFIGPYAVGLIKKETGGFTGGLVMLALLLLVGAIATLRLRRATVLATVE